MNPYQIQYIHKTMVFEWLGDLSIGDFMFL